MSSLAITLVVGISFITTECVRWRAQAEFEEYTCVRRMHVLNRKGVRDH